MKNIKKGFIYYLENPITKEKFYVGFTTQPLKRRLWQHYQHLKEHKRGERKTNRRFEYLIRLEPHKATIHLIEEIEGTLEEIELAEKKYIHALRYFNPGLTNMTDGGRGNDTNKYYTEKEFKEYSEKLSKTLKGKKKPKGFAENLSIQRRGLGNPSAKELEDWFVREKNGKYYLFKYGFEINYFLNNNKHAYNNVKRQIDNPNCKPYGYSWTYFSKLPKEIQDIVQSDYESNQ